ncbi:hypothetical protein CJU90_6273 [Yarrowia sp. C11]|nr:hypothetical protein CJU90_6273 [Yarrowia sp. C11]KAG5370978.1 hypothetical protein CKK34_1113 [Yarrowia sp. E02]
MQAYEHNHLNTPPRLFSILRGDDADVPDWEKWPQDLNGLRYEDFVKSPNPSIQILEAVSWVTDTLRALQSFYPRNLAALHDFVTRALPSDTLTTHAFVWLKIEQDALEELRTRLRSTQAADEQAMQLPENISLNILEHRLLPYFAALQTMFGSSWRQKMANAMNAVEPHHFSTYEQYRDTLLSCQALLGEHV